MAPEVFGQAIGSSHRSGRFFTKIAALRAYGLIGKEKRIAMTDRAKSIVSPVSEDSEQNKENIADAFLNPVVFRKIYDRISDIPTGSSRSILGNIATTEIGVSPKSKEKFAKIFVESGKFAEMLTETEDGMIKATTSGMEPDKTIEKENKSSNFGFSDFGFFAGANVDKEKTKKSIFNVEESGNSWSLQVRIVSEKEIFADVRESVWKVIDALNSKTDK